ncbi:unnamed protein product [Closterium sp. NIES-54]
MIMSCGSATTLDFLAFPSAFPSAEFTLEFPAFPSVSHCPFPSAFPSAEGVGAIPCTYPSVSTSPFVPSNNQLSVAAQVRANGGEPFPSGSIGDGGAASYTAAASAAFEDWCNEVAASMAQMAAPRVLGRKHRQRLMRQCGTSSTALRLVQGPPNVPPCPARIFFLPCSPHATLPLGARAALPCNPRLPLQPTLAPAASASPCRCTCPCSPRSPLQPHSPLQPRSPLQPALAPAAVLTPAACARPCSRTRPCSPRASAALQPTCALQPVLTYRPC